MDLPFTADQLFSVLARYNEAVWPAHIILRTMAIVAVVLAFVGQKAVDRSISVILGIFWLWMGLAYQFAFFTTITPAAWLFGALFLLQAVLLFWLGTAKGRVRFEFTWNWRSLAGLFLVALALIIYPALSYALGYRYPAVPTFGLPLPTTIFTIGVLLLAKPAMPRVLFIVPLIWTVVGSVAAFQLEVHQDLTLIIAGLVGLAGMVRASD
jgi:hypothetical protein